MLRCGATLLALLLRGPALCQGGCTNRYDQQATGSAAAPGCAQLLTAGFTCGADFCAADDEPDPDPDAAPPSRGCPYAGFCDAACGYCLPAGPPPPPLASSDCLDALPAELMAEYPNCTQLVARTAGGCEGLVRRGGLSAKVSALCGRA